MRGSGLVLLSVWKERVAATPLFVQFAIENCDYLSKCMMTVPNAPFSENEKTCSIP